MRNKKVITLNIKFLLIYGMIMVFAVIMTGLSLHAQISKENPVLAGIDVSQKNDFNTLQGKRVGLVTNPTGVNAALKSTVDILHKAPEVNLVALFGPEHGVRGSYDAGAKINDQKDDATGLPVYSLYGKNRKPTREMLKGLDVLVFDIQDIGSRSYTYISTLGLMMEAAAANNKEVVVLDRPNPLGGNLVEGTIWEKAQKSFVSQYNIPYVHGLTVGELARMLNGEGLLEDGVTCDLTVVEMQGWKRSMVFKDTGLPWVPTSPHIPHAQTPFYYAATGILGELSGNYIGIGYTLPFQVMATPWMDAQKLAQKMNEYNFKGVTFRPVYFRPYYKSFKGQVLEGVQIHITNFHQVQPSQIQFAFLHYIKDAYPEHDLFKKHKNRYNMFDMVCGSDKVRRIFSSENPDYEKFKELWYSGVKEYKQKASSYYLYD